MSILDDIVSLIRKSNEFTKEEKEELISMCQGAYNFEMETE